MPGFIIGLLLALGCAGTAIDTPQGPAASVWICPAPAGGPETPPAAPPAPEERGA